VLIFKLLIILPLKKFGVIQQENHLQTSTFQTDNCCTKQKTAIENIGLSFGEIVFN